MRTRAAAVALVFAVTLLGCRSKKPKYDLTQVATTTSRASDLAADASDLYWFDGAAIVRAPRKGGTATVVVATSSAQGFLMDSDFVYWTEFGPTGKVLQAPKIGGTSRAILQPAYDASLIGQDEEAVYVTVGGTERGVKRVLKRGGSAGMVLTQPARAVVADMASMYFATDDQIVRVSRGNGASVPLCKTLGLPRVLAQDDVLVYWTAETVPNALRSVAKAGGPNGKATTMVTFGAKELPRYVVVANGALYYTTTTDDGAFVYRRSLLGETTLLGLASNAGHSGFAVQGNSAFLLVAKRSGDSEIASVPADATAVEKP